MTDLANEVARLKTHLALETERADKADAAAKAGAELLVLAAGDLDDALERAEEAEVELAEMTADRDRYKRFEHDVTAFDACVVINAHDAAQTAQYLAVRIKEVEAKRDGYAARVGRLETERDKAREQRDELQADAINHSNAYEDEVAAHNRTMERLAGIEAERNALQYEIPIKGGGETFVGAIRGIVDERNEVLTENARLRKQIEEQSHRLPGDEERIKLEGDAMSAEGERDSLLGERAAYRARTEHAEAVPEVVEAVDAGEVTGRPRGSQMSNQTREGILR